jgi:hypothetical protein
VRGFHSELRFEYTSGLGIDCSNYRKFVLVINAEVVGFFQFT